MDSYELITTNDNELDDYCNTICQLDEYCSGGKSPSKPGLCHCNDCIRNGKPYKP